MKVSLSHGLINPHRYARLSLAVACALGAGMQPVFAQAPVAADERTAVLGPVVVIGADTPDVSRSDIARAFARLGAKAAVLGPARDGGYWLIGLRRRPRDRLPFDGIRWDRRTF